MSIVSEFRNPALDGHSLVASHTSHLMDIFQRDIKLVPVMIKMNKSHPNAPHWLDFRGISNVHYICITIHLVCVCVCV